MRRRDLTLLIAVSLLAIALLLGACGSTEYPEDTVDAYAIDTIVIDECAAFRSARSDYERQVVVDRLQRYVSRYPEYYPTYERPEYCLNAMEIAYGPQ